MGLVGNLCIMRELCGEWWGVWRENYVTGFVDDGVVDT